MLSPSPASITKLFSICKSIDDAYELLINLFNRNKATIKEISTNKSFKLNLLIYNNIKCSEEKVEIILNYNKNSKYFIINEVIHKFNTFQRDFSLVLEDNKKLKEQMKYVLEEISNIKKENNNLKKEINSLKSQNENKSAAQSIVDKEESKKEMRKQNKENNNNDKNKQENNSNNINNNNLFKTNPNNIHLLTELTDDSYSHWGIDNTFTTFTALDNTSYLVYATEEYSINFYNLNEQKLVKVIQNAHSEDIVTNFRHFVDKTKNRDILLSISADSRNVRLWDIKNWELLTNITNIYKTGYLYSASFLIDDNIDTYYDKKLSKYYILTGNIGYVKSYDYSENKLYYKYYDPGNIKGHDSIIIDDNKEMIKLIESGGDGFIRIWKFHNGLLLSKIGTGNNELRGLCLWNTNYLFVGCTDNTIKLIELKNGIIIKSLVGYNNEVCTIKKIKHPTFGECILTQGWENDQIKLWVNKN